jgi:hypothetical protein
MNKTLLYYFIAITLFFSSQINTQYTFGFRYYYLTYEPKTATPTEDYHTISIEYATNAFSEVSNSPNFYIIGNQASTPENAILSHKDKTNILYTKQAYLPGLPTENYKYVRYYPQGGSILKYYVMYDIQYSCSASVVKYTMKIKYFYCFTTARAFFENTSTTIGSGTGLKLIHNGVELEATLQTITAGASIPALKNAIMGQVNTC